MTNTELQHTPGPLRANGECVEAFYSNENGKPFYVTLFAPSTVLVKVRQGNNARLLVASYNAFDSATTRLGLNAVELAERMQDGGIADLIEALRQQEMAEADPEAGRRKGYFDHARDLRRAALAKVGVV